MYTLITEDFKLEKDVIENFVIVGNVKNNNIVFDGQGHNIIGWIHVTGKNVIVQNVHMHYELKTFKNPPKELCEDHDDELEANLIMLCKMNWEVGLFNITYHNVGYLMGAKNCECTLNDQKYCIGDEELIY